MRLGSMVFLVACSGARTPPPSPPANRVLPPARITLKKVDDHKLAVGADHLLEAWFDPDATEPTPWLSLTRISDGELLWDRQGYGDIGGSKRPQFEFCDERDITLAPLERADRPVARVGLICRHGEDNFVGDEYVILVDLGDLDRTPFPPLWAGSGDRMTTSYAQGEACLSFRTVTFELTADILTMSVESEQRPPEGEQGCRASTGKVSERIQVAKTPR